MNKEQLIQQLQNHHQQFADYISSLSMHEFSHQPGTKWTPGQQIDHIVKSIRPVTLAFTLPRIAPRLLFGKPNRNSKSYDELVARYTLKLNQGGKASGRFVPKEVNSGEKYLLPKAVMHYTNALCKQLEKINDEELDMYLLPHPLLGKLTFREMLYFTIYHVQHHHELTKREMGKNGSEI